MLQHMMMLRKTPIFRRHRWSRYNSDKSPVDLPDILWLGDMKEEEFRLVSSKLGHEYMSRTTDTPTFSVHGMVYDFAKGGKMVKLIVESRNIRICVPFILVGGSPVNIIGNDALAALEVDRKDIVNELNLTVHGFESMPFVHAHGDDRLRNINILGWMFFLSTGAFELLQATDLKVTLFKNEAQFLEMMTKDSDGKL